MCGHTPKDDLCIPIMVEELEKALQETRRGKAPGLDGISPEILKLGGPKLKAHLLSLCNTCWKRQTLPQDFKDALIITIYKRKGDRRECDNHQGISLLSVAGKVLAKIVLNRLNTFSEQLLPETQCGFHAGRSTADVIFTLRQLQEKAMEHQRSLYIVFMDFSKAFNTVNRWTLWKVLKAYGSHESFINMIRQFHDGKTGRVSIGRDISDAFPIDHGGKQGCVLAPTPFTLYLGPVLETMSTNLASGVYWEVQWPTPTHPISRLRDVYSLHPKHLVPYKNACVMLWCETAHKNHGIQHCHTPSLVIINRDNDSVLMSHKTTHKDPAATFASYNAYKMARKGTWCEGA